MQRLIDPIVTFDKLNSDNQAKVNATTKNTKQIYDLVIRDTWDKMTTAAQTKNGQDWRNDTSVRLTDFVEKLERNLTKDFLSEADLLDPLEEHIMRGARAYIDVVKNPEQRKLIEETEVNQYAVWHKDEKTITAYKTLLKGCQRKIGEILGNMPRDPLPKKEVAESREPAVAPVTEKRKLNSNAFKRLGLLC